MTATIQVYSWTQAITRSALPSTTRHVLLTLSLYMNQQGQGCFPSTRRMAGDTGLTERSVVTHLQRAKDEGWISVKEHGYRGQQWKRHEYIPHFPNAYSLQHQGQSSVKHSADEAAEKALNEVQQLTPKGTERGSVRTCEGAEPDDKKALNDVQSNDPIELSNDHHDQDDEIWISDKEREAIALANAFYALRQTIFGVMAPAEIPATDITMAEAFIAHPKYSKDRVVTVWRERMRQIKARGGKVPPVVSYLRKNVEEAFARLPALAVTHTPAIEAVPEWCGPAATEEVIDLAYRRLKVAFEAAEMAAWIARMRFEFITPETVIGHCLTKFHHQYTATHLRHRLERVFGDRFTLQLSPQRTQS